MDAAVMLNYFIIILIGFVTSLVLTPIVRDVAVRLGVMDKPGGRKIHSSLSRESAGRAFSYPHV